VIKTAAHRALLAGEILCPKCGHKVFVPSPELACVPLSKVDPGDPFTWPLFCSDMGHWAGYLHECRMEVGSEDQDPV